MNYKLDLEEKDEKSSIWKAAKALNEYVSDMRVNVFMSFVFLMINSAIAVYTPFAVGDITDKYIPIGDKSNLLKSLIFLLVIYIIGGIASYFQIYLMGRVGQRVLFKLRNTIFQKIQSLPLQFFNENKSGDLISRINNDTEKLNQVLSETLLRFLGDIFVIIGIGIAMVVINIKLGIIAVIVVSILGIITWFTSAWIKKKNQVSLQKLGEMSGEIQESISNFKVIIAFNRRDYFRNSFGSVNENNRKAATSASIANAILQPVYTYAGTIATLLIIVFGIEILIFDNIALGLVPAFGVLITFIIYSDSFFSPLKELAALYSSIQTGVAAWGRISKLLALQTNLPVEKSESIQMNDNVLVKFEDVSFGYEENTYVLKGLNLEMEKGKTYALVGPTGGGKTTTASLMARLYDVTEGRIILNGRNIKSYETEELSKLIGFILQEPFLFTGTLLENIKYGNEEVTDYDEEHIKQKLHDLGLEALLERFGEGLSTVITNNAENISLGQKQLIAFLRILLRQPKLLILDEATANIDTVTEKLLQNILDKLPKDTTKIMIAHRLNTIQNADQIFFIANGEIQKPVDFESALNLINTSKRNS